MGFRSGIEFKRGLVKFYRAVVIAFHLCLIGVLEDFPGAGEGFLAHDLVM